MSAMAPSIVSRSMTSGGAKRITCSLHQSLAERLGWTGLVADDHPDEHSLATHLDDVRGVDGTKLIHEPVADLVGALGEAFVNDDV